MHSCTCPPRQTLADRINAIIAKYEKCECPKPHVKTRQSCVPKIFSSPCLRGTSCNPTPCSPCFSCIPCPAITSSSSCSPQSTILPQPSPGPGLSRYISKRNLCPALRGCLSLYKRPSVACNEATRKPSCCRVMTCCPPTTKCNTLIDCPKSRTCCAIVGQNSRPLINTRSQGKAPSSLNSSCTRCKPCAKFPKCLTCLESISKTCCPSYENSCQRISAESSHSPRCNAACSVCCYSCNSDTTRLQCAKTCCCYSCTKSSEFSSFTPVVCGTCCGVSENSRPTKRRLTVFDDPPYTSNNLEREFSNRFMRLDSCYCETDSSSSLDNSNIGNKYR